MREITCQTRRHAIGALRNLSSGPKRSKVVLAKYNSGKVLTTLSDAAIHDEDQKVIDLSFACIANLTVHDTADLILSHPTLPVALQNVLLEGDSRDIPDSPKTHVAAVIRVFERSITPDMETYAKMKEMFSTSRSETNSPMRVTNPTEV